MCTHVVYTGLGNAVLMLLPDTWWFMCSPTYDDDDSKQLQVKRADSSLFLVRPVKYLLVRKWHC